MTFYYLLLGHLLGDFTFQTDRIAEYKNKELNWIALHSLIVTLSMLLFALPFGLKLMALVLVNGLLHFFIDYFKTKITIKKPLSALIYFLTDQAIHIYIIYLISILSSPDIESLPFSKEKIIFLIAFIFTLSFSTILVQMILKIIFSKYSHSFFIKNERAIGNITRVIAFLTFFFSFIYSYLFLVILMMLLTILIYFYRKKWYQWMNGIYFTVKIALDLTMAFIGFLILFTI